MRLVRLVAAFFLLAVPSAMSAAMAPPNDDFADAVSLNAIADTGGFVRANNVNATAEAGEPVHAGQAGGKSIWYSWTAPGDGSIPHVAFLAGGDFDTLLGVYTGSAVNALTPIASNDDVAGFGGGSRVSFATVAGTTYHIAIDGFLGKSGVAFFESRESPANDNFADAVSLSAPRARAAATRRTARRRSSEKTSSLRFRVSGTTGCRPRTAPTSSRPSGAASTRSGRSTSARASRTSSSST